MVGVDAVVFFQVLEGQRHGWSGRRCVLPSTGRCQGGL